jgi:succinylglutamic semialdehyde dehydrogenase
VNAAVDAARRAFPRWSLRTWRERAGFVLCFESVLKKRGKDLARLISREMGKSLRESEAEVERLLAKAKLARLEEPALIQTRAHRVDKNVVGRLTFRPRGILAVISPFNLPAYLASAQILPALLAGNTVVLKPSELVPFVGQFLAFLWQETHLPKGVFNLVQGAGDVGGILVRHEGVDGVIFTGSWETGSRIQEAVAGDPRKICALEMGGKNAAIVLKDADLEQAAQECCAGAFLTTGQRCNATSRILLEKSAAKKFLPAFLQRVENLRIGYGLDAGVFMGPLASRKGWEKVTERLKLARQEGFEVLREGGAASAARKGYYLRPSVHFREGAPSFPVRDGSYTDDEIFGPDVAIYVVRNLEEAVALNNRPPYGLVASVFTRSRKKFEKVRQAAQDGLIHWNVGTVRSSARLPFGGVKRSGNDRPAGSFSPFYCTLPTASLEKSRP